MMVYGSLLVLMAQKEDTSHVHEPLFKNNSLLDLRLEFDIDALMHDRGEVRHYHEALLKYTDETGHQHQQFVKIRARGNFRRDPNNCDFPPVHLKFSKKRTPNTIFEGQKKLKLVTHCQEEELIMKEYLAYKAYQVFTPASFHVRAARITYFDTKGRIPTEKKFAFFIEDPESLAERIGGVDVYDEGMPSEGVDSLSTLRLHFFAGLIGHTDWWVEKSKNVKFIRFKDLPAVPVPYDFDFAHIVGAPYIHLSDKEVENHRFRPICMADEHFEQMRNEFINKKEQLLELISQNEEVKKSLCKKSAAYLKSLLKRYENDWDEVLAQYKGNCKQKGAIEGQ